MDGMSILYMVGRGLVSPDLSRLHDTTPPGMREILTECISSDPERRPKFAEVATRCTKLLKKLPSLARAGSVSAIHGGRGKKSPIRWTPRPLSTRRHQIRTDSGIVASPNNLSIVTEGSSRRRAHSTCDEMSVSDYDNVQRLESGDLKISDGP
jgi:hypothetical protein